MMADAGHRLRIKFGLINEPSQQGQASWAAVVSLLVSRGYSAADAGEMAAKQLFPDYRQRVYASEGDTIEMLLRRIQDK